MPKFKDPLGKVYAGEATKITAKVDSTREIMSASITARVPEPMRGLLIRFSRSGAKKKREHGQQAEVPEAERGIVTAEVRTLLQTPSFYRIIE
jgi:hypothetical protein